MTMETWRQRQKARRRFFVSSGSSIRKQFMLNIDDKGCEYLVHTGNHNLYDEIQSYRDGCDLHMILNTLDPMNVNRFVSSYRAEDIINTGLVDIATMPHTYGGMFNLVKNGENFFNGLPEDIRKQFNYSVKKFCSSFGSQEFNDIFGQYFTSQQNQQIDKTEPKKKRGRPKKYTVDDSKEPETKPNEGGNE